MSNISFAEYLWIDGVGPARQIHSKIRTVNVPDKPMVTDFPLWHFDESQADGCDPGCTLTPMRIYRDPFRGVNDYIVLCEVNDTDEKIHASSTRARMRRMLNCSGGIVEPWLKFEQVYTLFHSGPEPEESCYCGVDRENAYGRKIAEAHVRTCINAGVLITVSRP